MSRLRWVLAVVCSPALLMGLAPPVAAATPAKTAISIGQAPIDSLDPSLSSQLGAGAVVNQLFRGLTAWDGRSGTLSLDLAASYSSSSDLTTWTFALQHGLHWSDNLPLTASDVVYAAQRSMGPSNTGPYQQMLTQYLAGVTAPDAQTVVFQFRQPAAFAPAFVSLSALRPVPQHVIQAVGAAWTEPANIVTSGAYKVASQSGTSLVLVRVPRDHRTAQIDQVTYQFGDPASLAADFATGGLDFVDSFNAGGTAAVAANPALAPFQTVTGPDDITEHLVFNAAYGSTANADVRHALSAATDRAGLSQAINGYPSLAAQTLIPPHTFGSIPDSAGVGITYDPAAANSYRTDAGSSWPSSVTINYPCNPRRQQEAAFLQSNWETVFGPGFTVNTECGPPGRVINSMFNPDPAGQADVTIIAWGQDYPDANDWLQDNQSVHDRWSDSSYSADLADAAGTLDGSRRQADYRDAQDILLDQVAAIATLYYRPDAYLSQPRLTVVGDKVENWSVA